MTQSLELTQTTSEVVAAADELGLVGRLHGNHYALHAGTPFELWMQDGWVLQEIEKRVGFWLGDWLKAGEDMYGERQYAQALKATGYAYQTLRNARHVAGRFPPQTRVHEGLAFGHYATATALPPADADELLEEASALKLSTRDLRERVEYRQDQIRAAERAALPVPTLAVPRIDLWVGDALDLTLDDEVVDLIVTSPPYALDKAYADGGDIAAGSWFGFMRLVCDEAFRVAKTGARFALNVPVDTTLGGFRPTYAEAVSAGLAAGWKYRSSIVWIDNELGKSTARGSYDQVRQTGTAQAPSIIAPAEMIILFSKGPWRHEEPADRPSDITHDDWIAWTNGIWTFPGESSPWEEHEAPFPEELPRRLLHLLSFPGDLVLDPFLGSGTTGLSALKTGRRFVGVDRSERYVNAARRRIAAELARHPGLADLTWMS